MAEQSDVAVAEDVKHSTASDAPNDESTETKAVKSEDTKDEKSAEVKDEKKEDVKDEKPSRDSRGYDGRKKSHNDIKNAYKDARKNVRTNFEALPETDDPDEIRKQVEFYFSDSNLAYDDHMRSRVLGNKNNEYGANHAVPIKDIHSFKRMKRFQPYSAVVAALKESKTLEVVGDKEDEVRRKVALEKPSEEDQEFGDPTIPRAIYAKGFGEEGSTTQFDIEAFFTPYGPLNSVRLRRTFPDRHFKGSVFVEFETEELQKEFLAMDPKPKFEGQELLIKSKRQYCDEKMQDVKSGKIQSNKRPLNFKGYYQGDHHYERRDNGRDHGRNDRNGRGRGRGDRGGRGGRGGNRRDDRDNRRDDRDRDDWRGRRDDFQKNGHRDRRSKREDGDSDEFGRDTKKTKEEDSETKPIAENGASKKRERDDGDAPAVESETKKVKADE